MYEGELMAWITDLGQIQKLDELSFSKINLQNLAVK